MSNENIYDGITGIREDIVQKVENYQFKKKENKKSGKKAWMKWGAMAACACLVGVLMIFPYKNWTEHSADDPNWERTHFQTSELSEIEALCGTDLLLDQISMPGEYYREYVLEISENGLFDNTADWNNLSVFLSNGSSINDHSSADYIYCFISFDGNTEGINSSLWENDTTMEMNGYILNYCEKTTSDYAKEGITLGYKQDYHGYATFDHAGYTYYVSTHSNDPDFFDETIKNKLIYGATHDPDADNSEHAITGPGKPLESNE